MLETCRRLYNVSIPYLIGRKTTPHEQNWLASDVGPTMIQRNELQGRTRALLRLERTMNLLEGGKGGEGRMGETGWGGDGGREGGERGWREDVGREGGWERGRVGEGRGVEGRGGEGRGGRGGEGWGGEGREGEGRGGRDDGYTYCNRYAH